MISQPYSLDVLYKKSFILDVKNSFKAEFTLFKVSLSEKSKEFWPVKALAVRLSLIVIIGLSLEISTFTLLGSKLLTETSIFLSGLVGWSIQTEKLSTSSLIKV